MNTQDLKNVLQQALTETRANVEEQFLVNKDYDSARLLDVRAKTLEEVIGLIDS